MQIFKCPNCNFKSNQVELITTEIGQVRWLNSEINGDGTIKDLGNDWKYEGGETQEENGYQIICKKCGELLKGISEVIIGQ